MSERRRLSQLSRSIEGKVAIVDLNRVRIDSVISVVVVDGGLTIRH